MTRTIRRAARRQRFVIVDQSAVEDRRLSWAARGLLAYLLSRPDDWKVLVNDLRKRGNLGRDGIYSLLRELRAAGYLCYQHNRDARGRLRGGTYIVSELPAPRPGLPDTDGPDPAAPCPAKPEALPNTDIHQRTTTTTRPTDNYAASGDQQEPLQIPAWVRVEMHAAARHLVAGLARDDAQLVIDEWAGALAAGVIQRSPLGYLKTLAERWAAGDMSLRHAGTVAPPW